jgi:hypothetical protein
MLLNVQIEALGPLAFAERRPNDQFRASLPYVPGGTIFAALGANHFDAVLLPTVALPQCLSGLRRRQLGAPIADDGVPTQKSGAGTNQRLARSTDLLGAPATGGRWSMRRPTRMGGPGSD